MRNSLHSLTRLVCKNEFGVTLGGVARACISAVHPVHEVTVRVPDREDQDHSALKGVAHGLEAPKAVAFCALGVAVFLEKSVHAC